MEYPWHIQKISKECDITITPHWVQYRSTGQIKTLRSPSSELNCPNWESPKSPKCLQRVWNHCDKIQENPFQDLHFNMFLGLGACPGTLWRPSWAGNPKNHKKTTFRDPPFGAYLWQMLVLLWWRFLHVFWTSLLLSFCSRRHPQESTSKVFGNQFGHSLTKSGKVETVIL